MKKIIFLIFIFLFLSLQAVNFAQAADNCYCVYGYDTTATNTCDTPCSITDPTNSPNYCSCEVSGTTTTEIDCETNKTIITNPSFKKVDFTCMFDNSGTSPNLPSGTAPNLPSGTSPNADTNDQTYKLPNFLGTDDPNVVVGRVIKFIIGISGTAALIIFIYGGGLWLFSRGKDEMIGKGKKAMISAVIGLIIIFSSYVLVRFIISAITFSS